MAFVAPEEKHLVPGQGSTGIRRQQIEEAPGSGTARQRDGEASALGHRFGAGADYFFGGRGEQFLRGGEGSYFGGGGHGIRTVVFL